MEYEIGFKFSSGESFFEFDTVFKDFKQVGCEWNLVKCYLFIALFITHATIDRKCDA